MRCNSQQHIPPSYLPSPQFTFIYTFNYNIFFHVLHGTRSSTRSDFVNFLNPNFVICSKPFISKLHISVKIFSISSEYLSQIRSRFILLPTYSVMYTMLVKRAEGSVFLYDDYLNFVDNSEKTTLSYKKNLFI